MIKDLLFIAFGYLLGGILFARLFGFLINGKDITIDAKDKNPGTANAYLKGGFWCGTLTLLCDIAKGFLPVMLYQKSGVSIAFVFVIVAPVIGHIFPIYTKFKGGKGIATTFGCLLGLFPNMTPAVVLAIFFVFFSVVICVSSHFYRTLVAYIFTEITLILLRVDIVFILAFGIILFVTALRMIKSHEEKGALKIGFLWKR